MPLQRIGGGNLTMTKKIALFEWLQGFPEHSRQKLCRINGSATNAGHVVLAVAYGLCDPYIRHVNRIIANLLVRQMQAERRGDLTTAERLHSRLTDLHVAIDWATGVYPPLTVPEHRNLEDVCSRVASRNLRKRSGTDKSRFNA
jgi:hypothetical protein